MAQRTIYTVKKAVELLDVTINKYNSNVEILWL
jgi:hypothetical protein